MKNLHGIEVIEKTFVKSFNWTIWNSDNRILLGTVVTFYENEWESTHFCKWCGADRGDRWKKAFNLEKYLSANNTPMDWYFI